MKKIKVMQIVLSLECGGAERIVVNLVNRLKERFDFSVCVLDKLGDLEGELGSKIRVDCMERIEGIDFFLPFKMARLIKEISPDVIHVHNPTCLFYTAMAVKLAGRGKIVFTQHGLAKKSWKMVKALRFLSRFITKAVAVSDDIAGYLEDSYGVNKERIKIIINGIDENVYKSDQSRSQDIKEKFNLNGEYVIGHVARLSPEKDQATLLKAFCKVNSEMERVKLVIVGDGPLKDSLRSKVKSLKLEDKVLFLGSRNDVQELMNMFDLFVLSSIREGTSLTLLEAMAAGLPIVATKVGGNADVVIDKKTGLLVPPKEPDKLAEAVINLLKDNGLRKKMGKEGRKMVEEKFCLDRMAKEYEKIYRDLAL